MGWGGGKEGGGGRRREGRESKVLGEREGGGKEWELTFQPLVFHNVVKKLSHHQRVDETNINCCYNLKKCHHLQFHSN